jgi:hypothetical protein
MSVIKQWQVYGEGQQAGWLVTRDIRASRVSLCDEYAVNNPLLQLMASIKQDS